MRTLKRTALALALSASLFVASAAQAGDFGKRGLYFGLNGAYGIDLFSAELAGVTVGSIPGISIGNSGGLNTRVGYRAFSVLALEAEYEWMKGIDVALNGVEVGTYKPHSLTGNAKLFLPIWRIQPYLLAGAGISIWQVEVIGGPDLDGTGFAFRGGAGADVYLTESLSVNAEGTAVLNTSGFEVDLVTANLYYFSISAGLTYHF